MGKFLLDKDGRMVALGGTPVLEKTLDRKPRNCQSCGFDKWAKGDKLFILSGNEWVCPDCAVANGLPVEHYHRNHYATQPPPAGYQTSFKSINVPNGNRKLSGVGECMAFMCYF